MDLLTEEVKILECSVHRQGALEDSFLKKSTRQPGVSEELLENIRSAPTKEEGEVRREETPLSFSPLTSQMLMSGFDETILLENTLVQSFSPDHKLQQWDALSNYAKKRDLSSSQKANIPDLTYLLPNQEPPADIAVKTHKGVLKIGQYDSAKLRPESTEATASPQDIVKTSLISPDDIPTLETKVRPALCEDQRAYRNQFSQVLQEKNPVFSLEAHRMKNTALTEQKLESSKKVLSSTTTTTVAVSSLGDQKRVGRTLDTVKQSLHGGPQSGLSCSGSLH